MRKNKLVAALKKDWKEVEARLQTGFTRLRTLRWRIQPVADFLDRAVGILLRLGTILLIVLMLIFVAQLLRDRGYVIEAFSVPQVLGESGYDGAVIAHKLQDKVLQIKQEVNSAKADSVRLVGDQEPSLDLAVLGIGFSLQSISFHLRKLLGYENKLIRGEIVHSENEYLVTLRLTGQPPLERRITFREGDKLQSAEALIHDAAEAVLEIMDPYRLAVYCYNQKRYDEAMRMINRVLHERPNEAHWAYLAWGQVLNQRQLPKLAAQKFRKSLEIEPDFILAWQRLAWAEHQLDNTEESRVAMTKLLELADTDHWRWVSMGWLAFQQQDFPLADSLFEQAIAIDPTNPELYGMIADSYFSRNDFAGAVPYLEIADSLAGNNEGALMVQAMLAMSRGDTTGAVDIAYEAWELNPESKQITQMCAQAAYMKRDYKRLGQLYQRGNWQQFDDNYKQRFLNTVAMGFNYSGNPERAMEAVDQSIAVIPERGYPYSTKAEIYALQGDMEQFYHYLELAFENGMRVGIIRQAREEPYRSLHGVERFEELLNRYDANTKVIG